MTMGIMINDEKAKDLLKQVLIERITLKQDLFHKITLEGLEEVAVARAISEGRKNDFVSEEEIFELLPNCFQVFL